MKNYRSLLLCLAATLVLGCGPRNYLADVSVSSYRMDGIDDPAPSARIDSVIKPYRDQLTSVMEEVVGHSAVLMEKSLPEGGLNNWFADALLRSGSTIFGREVDVALQNYGGIRIGSIGVGPVTRGKVFELMPFENLTVLVYLDSARVQAVCDDLAGYGGGVVSHTLKFGILEDKAYMVEIAGEPLRGDREYAFVFPDYVVNGGSIGRIVEGARREDSSVLIRDAILMDLKRMTETGEKVRGVMDGRIYFVND